MTSKNFVPYESSESGASLTLKVAVFAFRANQRATNFYFLNIPFSVTVLFSQPWIVFSVTTTSEI